MKNISIMLVCLFILSACGAKTKTELIAEARLHEEYTVNKNYQEVYREIADKFVECSDSMAPYLRRNLYSDLGEGELYLHGADSAGYAFLVSIKKIGDTQTEVKVYSKISTGLFPSYMQTVRMGAYGQSGCPK